MWLPDFLATTGVNIPRLTEWSSFLIGEFRKVIDTMVSNRVSLPVFHIGNM